MVKAKPVKPLVIPSYSADRDWLDSRGVEYVNNNRTYLTTHQLAKELGMYPETLFRWCRRWFGDLPDGRTGAKMGYRIPEEYRLVARVWLQTEDRRIREVARRALVDNPRNWVVVVANIGSTHYSDREVVGRVESLLSSSAFRTEVVTILYVGPPDK